MEEVHEGIYGIHQSAHKMKSLLCRVGFFWPTMINDCFRYYKGCESRKKFRDVQLAPAAMLHPIIKPWPFQGWALDFLLHLKAIDLFELLRITSQSGRMLSR
jgi:hypothetical protein